MCCCRRYVATGLGLTLSRIRDHGRRSHITKNLPQVRVNPIMHTLHSLCVVDLLIVSHMSVSCRRYVAASLLNRCRSHLAFTPIIHTYHTHIAFTHKFFPAAGTWRPACSIAAAASSLHINTFSYLYCARSDELDSLGSFSCRSIRIRVSVFVYILITIYFDSGGYRWEGGRVDGGPAVASCIRLRVQVEG